MSHEGQSDHELVRMLRSGDAAAAGVLAERYRQPLVRFARSLLNYDSLAEEIAQEALSRLCVEHLPEGHLRPWLYKVTRNLCLDVLRRRNISPTHGGQMPDGFDASRDTAGPATRAAEAERAERIRRVLADMPEEYRMVVLLKHTEGLSREEIAEVLEISDAAVKGRLVRGMEYLREQLGNLTERGR
jgi:RNA polymerase sigma-70 factor (ECF subfamily)